MGAMHFTYIIMVLCSCIIIFSTIAHGEIFGWNMSRYCSKTVISDHIFLVGLEKHINVVAGK